MKKLYTIGISLLFLSFSLKAQVPGYFELTVTDLPGTATNRAVVKMRAVNTVVPLTSTCDGNDAIVTNILTGMTFGIKWLVSSGITQVTFNTSGNSIGACPDIDPASGYGIATGGANMLSNDMTTRARPFLANFTPSPIPLDWIGNQWMTICTLNITGGSCTTCEALDIYVLGDFPEMEAQADLSPVFSIDVTGSNNVVYEALPNNAPLPLNLISFEAEKYETQDAYLSWTTANEENTSSFQIQRSFDKKSWTTIGNVGAAGYSIDIRNYSYMDYHVYNGRDARLPVYYRLNMVDLDGRQRYSPIESVIFSNGLVPTNKFYVYPNPATDGVQVEWDADNVDQPTSFEFYDVTGKLVYVEKVGDKAVQEYVDFVQANIHSGVYLLRIMSGTEPIEHKQIVVGGR
jgi:Secretion system C-terminal sorting domain